MTIMMTKKIRIMMMRDIGKPCAELLMSAGAEMALAEQGDDFDDDDDDDVGDDSDDNDDDHDDDEGGQGGQPRPHQDR